MDFCRFSWYEVYDPDMTLVSTTVDLETAKLICLTSGIVFSCQKEVGINEEGGIQVSIFKTEVRC